MERAGAWAHGLCARGGRAAAVRAIQSSQYAASSPPDERRQAHEIRLRVRVGAKAKLSPPVVHEVELDVAATLEEQFFARSVIKRCVLATRDNPWKYFEKRLPHRAHKGKVRNRISACQLIEKNPAD